MRIDVVVSAETLEEAAHVFAQLAHPSVFETAPSSEWQFIKDTKGKWPIARWRIVD